MNQELQIADLRSFAAAVRAGSITRAAAALGVSQPTVSQRIRRLERAAGGRLLLRNPQGTRVTPAGETLLAYAERMLAIHDQARAAVGGPDQASTGQRTVGLLEDLAITTLPTALADFAALHPAIALEVVIGSADTLRRLADRGHLDLALGDPSVMAETAIRWRHQVPLTWVHAPSMAPGADPLPLVMFSHPCRWRQPVLDALERHGRRYRIAFQSTSVHAVQAAIIAGIGMGTLLPGNIPSSTATLGARHDLPPAPAVEIAISRRAGTGTDPAIDSLEHLLKQAAS